MLKAVIFDMDGVLFDSEQAIIDCWIPVAEKYGIRDVVPQLMKCIGITESESAKVFRSVYGQDFPYEKVRKEVNDDYRKFCDEGRLPVKPGVRELLSYLEANGIRTAIASSGDRDHVRRLLEKAGILPYFQVIVGGDMVARSKPAPDVFLKAEEELRRLVQDDIRKQVSVKDEITKDGIAKAVLPKEDIRIIEDSYQGVRAACAAGIPVIMVPDLLPPTEECEEKAEQILSSLVEVLALFEKENGAPAL